MIIAPDPCVIASVARLVPSPNNACPLVPLTQATVARDEQALKSVVVPDRESFERR
jgi:hypothetical protein